MSVSNKNKSHLKISSGGTDTKKAYRGKDVTSNVGKFHLTLYEQTLNAKHNINHHILQNQSQASATVAEGAKKIHCDVEGLVLATQETSDSLKHQQNETNEIHKQLYQQLLEKSLLIEMQEERRKKAMNEIESQEKEAKFKQTTAENLLQRAVLIQDDTLRTRSKVEAFRAYKDYVEKSVPFWEKEANSVETVYGRFRDLLTLRFQLLTEVQAAFKKLQKTRERYENLVKNEKIAEGKALLEVYHHRSSSWQSNRDVEAADDQLRRLRNSSSEIATRLTRMKLALANMYSVARKFQATLPPLEASTPSMDLIVHLHNFILDASKVVKIAKVEENADSQKQIRGSSG